MSTLQHKHHKYSFSSKSNTVNSNNNLRMKRMGFLKRRVETAHQPLQEQYIDSVVSNEDDYGQVCYRERIGSAQNGSSNGQMNQRDDNVDKPSMSNIQIDYCLAKSESRCETRDKQESVNELGRRSVNISYCVSHAKGGVANPHKDPHDDSGSRRGGSLYEIPTWDRDSRFEMAKANSFGSNTFTDPASFPTGDRELDEAITAIVTLDMSKRGNSAATPMSMKTAEHVQLLNLDQHSSLKERAMAALEMLQGHIFFTKNGPTLSRSRSQDTITNKSLSSNVDSFKSTQNTPKSEARSIGDIDIVVTESQEGDENENNVDDNFGNVSSLLNDFSFNLRQMLNNTFTSEDESIHSITASDTESIPTLQNVPNDATDHTVNAPQTKSELLEHSAMKTFGRKKSDITRFSIANVVKAKRGFKRSDSSSCSNRDFVDSSLVSVENVQNNEAPTGSTKRLSMNLGSTKAKGRHPSLHGGEHNMSMPSIKKITLNLGNKLSFSRTNSTPANSTSDYGSVTELVHDDGSIPVMDDDEITFSSEDSADSEFCSSSLDSDDYDRLLVSTNRSIDHSVSSEDSLSVESDDSSHEEDGEHHQSIILEAISNVKIGIKRNMLDKIEQQIEKAIYAEIAALPSENSNPNLPKDPNKFSTTYKLSPSKETLGLEMIANPELLEKYY